MAPKLTKLNSLIKILNQLNNQDKINISHLVDALGVAERTAYRYMSTLQDAGYPIYFDRDKMSYSFSSGFNLNSSTTQSIIHSLDIKSQIMASTSVGVLVYAASGECVDVNDAAVSMLGTTRDYLVEQNYFHIDSWQESGLLSASVEVMSTGKSSKGDYFLRTTTGLDLWVYCSLSCFMKESKKYLIAVIEDISERKKLESKLKKTRDNLLFAQQIAKMGSATLDLATGTVTWTPEIYRMFGLPQEMPVPSHKKHEPLFTPSSWLTLTTHVTQTSNDGVPFEIELELVRSDSTNGWVFLRGEAEFGNSGAIEKIHAVAMDISYRKRVELKANQTEKLLSTFIQNSPIYAFIKDENSRPVHISANFIEITRFNSDEMLKMTTEEMFSAEYAVQSISDDRLVLETNSTMNVEREIHGRIYNVVKTPIEIDGAKFIAGYLIDITETKKNEAYLKKYSDIFEVLKSTTTDAFITLDCNGVIVDGNCRALEMYGYSEGELCGKHISELDDRESYQDATTHISNIVAKGFDRFVTKHIAKSKISLPVEVSATHVPDSELIIGFVRLID